MVRDENVGLGTGNDFIEEGGADEIGLGDVECIEELRDRNINVTYKTVTF